MLKKWCGVVRSNQFEMLRDLIEGVIESETWIFSVRRNEAFENEAQATSDEIAEHLRKRKLAERQLEECVADCVAFGATIGIESGELSTGLSTLLTNVSLLDEWQSTRFRPVWSYAEDRSLGGWLSAEETFQRSVRQVKDALAQPVILRFAAQVTERQEVPLNFASLEGALNFLNVGVSSDTTGKTKASTGSCLRPCDYKAFSQFNHAVDQDSTIKTDDEAYDWTVDDLKEDDIELPKRESWKRYVGRARTFHGEQKNGPRIGNETRSVVSATRIDAPKRTKTDQR